MKLPKRKHIRLKDYDYGQGGAYFITICTKDREPLLGTIPVGRDAHIPPQTKLSAIGGIADRHIRKINDVYSTTQVEKYIIMPNHIHLLLVLADNTDSDGGMWASRPTIQTIVRSFKTMVTKEIGHSIWQASFFDHIIRDEDEFLAVWKYIDENPLKWELDELHV
ncbi:MAG: transposase [Clostridia bacterium]|nr:transposase [Clostridia bacterium]